VFPGLALDNDMNESDTGSQSPPPEVRTGLPHEFDHTHSDVSGWLRAAFGAMDGLFSNTALIAGVAASVDAHTVILSGTAGLLAGAFSMALGQYTSVTTANEQIDSEVRVERHAFRTHPQAEKAELVHMLVNMGMTEQTVKTATDEIHRDERSRPSASTWSRRSGSTRRTSRRRGLPPARQH
jgi:vacuolar iron transporter family protein